MCVSRTLYLLLYLKFHEETYCHQTVHIEEYKAQTEKYTRRTCELPEHERRFIEGGGGVPFLLESFLHKGHAGSISVRE